MAVVYYFQKFTLAEYNYPIFNKEILLIIEYLEEQLIKFRNYKKFVIIINYRNFECFMKMKKYLNY